MQLANSKTYVLQHKHEYNIKNVVHQKEKE